MTGFLDKIISEICKEEGIKYKNISRGYITILEKDGKISFLNRFQMGLNSQVSGLIADDKFAMYEVLRFFKIPVIEQDLIWDRNNKKCKKQIEEKIKELNNYFEKNNNHIVLKPNTGYGGQKVFNIKEEKEIKKALKELLNYTNSIIVSPFYNIKSEHRLIMLNGECRLAFTKVLPTNGWQFNLSKGCTAIKITDENLKTKLLELAKKACSAIDAKFVSVDIVEDFKGNLFVLEINSRVVMKRYLENNKEDYELVKSIYKDAIKANMSGN